VAQLLTLFVTEGEENPLAGAEHPHDLVQ